MAAEKRLVLAAIEKNRVTGSQNLHGLPAQHPIFL